MIEAHSTVPIGLVDYMSFVIYICIGGNQPSKKTRKKNKRLLNEKKSRRLMIRVELQPIKLNIHIKNKNRKLWTKT